MRVSLVIVLVAACGGGGVKDIKDTPPPAAAETCRTAGTKLIELVVAGQDPAPPDEAVNKLITLVEKRCNTDGWKQDARSCFSKVKSVEEADVCTKTLSNQELANLSNDMKPPAGDATGAAPPPSGAAEGGSGRTRGAEDKKGNGASADPCDGGE
ncbi:MAG: hypothetical protein ACKV2T_22845 [Kofleriaceae bacterium]